MGAIIQARCTCGAGSKLLFVGAGFRSNNEECMAPAACYTCGKIFTQDILEDSNSCPTCKKEVIPFGKIMSSKITLNKVFSWGIDIEKDYVLEDMKYKCPKCGEEELTFSNCGCWD